MLTRPPPPVQVRLSSFVGGMLRCGFKETVGESLSSLAEFCFSQLTRALTQSTGAWAPAAVGFLPGCVVLMLCLVCVCCAWQCVCVYVLAVHSIRQRNSAHFEDVSVGVVDAVLEWVYCDSLGLDCEGQ